MPFNILVVDDEVNILELLKYNLEGEEYKVITSESGYEAVNFAKQLKPDFILLDVMLPDMSGFEVCKILKSDTKTRNIPIIMLTAKSEEVDKILGLELGADDYITKPFSVKELLTRIKVVLRRVENSKEVHDNNKIFFGDIVIDTQKYAVYKKGVKLDLTLKEFELLKVLAIHKGHVLTREFLLEKIWGYEFMGDTRTVDVHIRYLRKKIEEDDKEPKYIETVRGIGYRLNAGD